MQRGLGCINSPKDLRDYRISKMANIILPEEFMLETKTIKDQGAVGSCVAHALSSALEIQNNDVYSTGWIYGYRPEDYYQDIGMVPREALKTIQQIGAVENKDFNVNIEMEDAKKEVDKNLNKLQSLASKYKIKSYGRLYTQNEIKQFLYMNKVAIPISVPVNDFHVYKGIIEDLKDEQNSGNHMILIVGWNEKGFVVQNSWGTNWGNNGLATLPYNYKINEAWRNNI